MKQLTGEEVSRLKGQLRAVEHSHKLLTQRTGAGQHDSSSPAPWRPNSGQVKGKGGEGGSKPSGQVK